MDDEMLEEQYAAYFTAVCHIIDAYRIHGRYTDAEHLLRQALLLAADETADVPAKARLQVQLGALQICREQHEEAVQTLKSAQQQLAKQPTDPAYSAALRFLGEALYRLKLLRDEGDYDQMLSLYQQALALREAGANQAAVADTLFYMGIAWERKGEMETAVSHFRRAYDLAQSVGDKLTMSYAIRHLGFNHWRSEELDEAWACLNESLVLRQEIGFIFGQVFAHAILSRFLRTVRQDLEGALQHAQSAVEIATQLQHQTALSSAWLQMAAWHEVNGEADKARSYYEKALKAATVVRNKHFCQVIQDQLNKLPVGGAA